jgi:hypothetical protein
MTTTLSDFARRLRDWLAADAFPEADFNALALELFRLQFAANVPYARLCRARGVTPEQVQDWRQIPAVPAAAFKECELTCLPLDERRRVFHSSGTTAHTPSRHFHSEASLAVYEASLWPWFKRHVSAGLSGTNWHWIALTPPPAAAPHSSLVHMLETVAQRSEANNVTFGGTVDAAGAWHIEPTVVRAALGRAVAAGEPVCLLGTAFNFIHLLDELAQSGERLQLLKGSVVMETGGYKGRSRELPKAELHALIQYTLGVTAAQIVCEYGMSELSSQAYDLSPAVPGARRFRFPPWCRWQLVSPENGQPVAVGEVGLVRVCDLANVFSVAALQTEDLAVNHNDGFELIGRAPAAEPRGCSLQAA